MPVGMYPALTLDTGRHEFAEPSFPKLLEALSEEAPWPPGEGRRTAGDDALMFILGLLTAVLVAGLIRGCIAREEPPPDCQVSPGRHQCITDFA